MHGDEARTGDRSAGDDAGAGDASPGVPVLDRPAQIARTCSITGAPALLGTQMWFGGAVARTPEGFAVARSEGSGTGSNIVLSLIDRTPSLGADLYRYEPAGSAAIPFYPALATFRDTLAIAWFDSQVRFARAATTGRVLTPAVAVVDDAWVGAVALANTGTGYLLGWNGGSGFDGPLNLVTLGDDGVPTSEAVTLDAGESPAGRPVILVEETGYVIAWSAVSSSNGADIYVARLKPDLSVQVSPAPISPARGSGYRAHNPSLVATSSGYLAAWVEAYWNGGGTSPKAYKVIALARLDQNLARVGASAHLQAPVMDVQNSHPVLVAAPPYVALIWSMGTIIHVCAGCVPDDVLELVLLDPVALVRASKVVELESPAGGGLLLPTLVTDGTDFLTTFDVTYHTSSTPAAAVVRCQ